MSQQSLFHACFRAPIAFIVLWIVSVSQLHSALGQGFRPGVEYGSVSEIPMASAEEAFATYDAATGNVYLSVGSGVNFILLVSDEPSPFLLGNLRPEIAHELSMVGIPHDRPGFFFLESFARPFENTGNFNLGPILPANDSITSILQFEQAFSSLVVERGVPGATEFPTAAFNLIPGSGVPEPNTAGVLLLAGLHAITRRRR
jgi:hypothetical protein